RHSIESVDRRDDRLGTRIDEDLFSAEAPGLTAGAFNFDRPRVDETRLSADDVQIRGGFQDLLVAISKALDDLLFALPHPSQIHCDGTSLHAIITCPPGKIGDTRACRHGFSRRSTVIDAASSQIPLFYDSGLEPRPGQHHREGEPSLAGADDNRVMRSCSCHVASLGELPPPALRRPYEASTAVTPRGSPAPGAPTCCRRDQKSRRNWRNRDAQDPAPCSTHQPTFRRGTCAGSRR